MNSRHEAGKNDGNNITFNNFSYGYRLYCMMQCYPRKELDSVEFAAVASLFAVGTLVGWYGQVTKVKSLQFAGYLTGPVLAGTVFFSNRRTSTANAIDGKNNLSGRLK